MSSSAATELSTPPLMASTTRFGTIFPLECGSMVCMICANTLANNRAFPLAVHLPSRYPNTSENDIPKIAPKGAPSMGRRILNRKELRADFDAAETRKREDEEPVDEE